MASGGWAETPAASRWLDHPALAWREILQLHPQGTAQPMPGHPVSLGLQDTPALDFTSQPGIVGLGRLSYAAQQGLDVQPPLAVPPEGVALGVLDAWIWARGPKAEPQVQASTRWVEGYDRVAELAEIVPDPRGGSVAEREGDRRALMAAAAQRGTPADWLGRAKHNRPTGPGEPRWARLARSEPLGEGECWLPAAPGRPARGGRQPRDVQSGPLPARQGAPAVTLTAMLAREEQPPVGQPAIAWRLVPNRTAEPLEQVAELIAWSRRRGLIEIFFRSWKSGCRGAALPLGPL